MGKEKLIISNTSLKVAGGLSQRDSFGRRVGKEESLIIELKLRIRLKIINKR